MTTATMNTIQDITDTNAKALAIEVIKHPFNIVKAMESAQEALELTKEQAIEFWQKIDIDLAGAILCGYDNVAEYKAEVAKADKKRKAENEKLARTPIMKRLKDNDGRFATAPNDHFDVVIEVSKYYSCISDTMHVRLTNGETVSDAYLKNTPNVWKALKQLNETGGRSVDVIYVTNDDGQDQALVERVPFAESEPFKYRFK